MEKNHMVTDTKKLKTILRQWGQAPTPPTLEDWENYLCTREGDTENWKRLYKYWNQIDKLEEY